MIGTGKLASNNVENAKRTVSYSQSIDIPTMLDLCFQEKSECYHR
jgi:hypothetical protein